MAFLPDGRRVVFTRSTGPVRVLSDGEGWVKHTDIVVRHLFGRHSRVVLRGRPFAGDNVQMVCSPRDRTVDGSCSVPPANGDFLDSPLYVILPNGRGLRQVTRVGPEPRCSRRRSHPTGHASSTRRPAVRAGPTSSRRD